MAEIQLKKKVTLKRKGETAAFTFDGKLKVKLYWSSETDLDLCLFFKRKDGEVGGVFSNEYRGKKKDLGCLDAFPYMLHLGDAKYKHMDLLTTGSRHLFLLLFHH